MAKKIQVARSFGDLSENAEYDAAREEQAHLEKDIEELKQFLKNASVIDLSKIKKNEVSIGKTVTLLMGDTKQEETYHLTGSGGANSVKNIISIDSPVGEAINHKKVKDVVTVSSPNGVYDITILKVVTTKKDTD